MKDTNGAMGPGPLQQDDATLVATFDAWWQTGEPQRILGDRYNDMEVREIMRKTWEAAK